MEPQTRKTAERRGFLDGTSSRRDFLKLAAMAAAGGVSALVVPGQGREALANMSAVDGGYWNQVRSRFVLDPRITYLNTGTEGAMPRDVLKGLNEYLIRFASSPMEAAALSADFSYFQQTNRERAAAFVGARPAEIVLTTNTTEGMNVVIHGLDLKAGDEVITTFHDHSAGLSPLGVVRDRSGVILKQLALPSPAPSKEAIVDLFRNAVTPNTKVFCFCHVNYTTGLRMPVRELCDLARSSNIITVVDGAHALGMLGLDLRALGCDFYSCAGHKWLNAPPGTGVLYIRDGEQNPHRLWPVMTEAYGFPGPITTVLQVRGQQNTPALKAMGDAMDFQEEIGKARVEARIAELNRYLKTRVVEAWGESGLLTPLSDELSTGIASFIPFANTEDRYDGPKFSAVVTALRQTYKIYVRSVSFKDRESDAKNTNALRVSTHLFNSFEDIDKLVDALQEVLRSSTALSTRAATASETDIPEFVN